MLNLVKKERAPRYIFIVVVSFAVTILATRLLLYLTGYPKLGNGFLHIAHVLWGGVLLTIGSCLILIFSNAKSYYISSVLIGIGMGLFFDEIGKFVTESNDYFFQAAAPIIYIIFLLVFFVYLYLKKPRKRSQRELFYHVLDDMKEILDEDLDPIEKDEIMQKLQAIAADTNHKGMQKISKHLYDYVAQLSEDERHIEPFISRYFRLIKVYLRRQKRMHQVLFWGFIGLLVFRSVNSIINLIYAWFLLLNVDRWYVYSIDKVVGDLIINKSFEFNILIIQTFAEGIVGLMILGAVMKRLRRRRGGLVMIRFALLFSILTIDVIILYFEQFSYVAAILVDVMLIIFLDFYGRIYDDEKL